MEKPLANTPRSGGCSTALSKASPFRDTGQHSNRSHLTDMSGMSEFGNINLALPAVAALPPSATAPPRLMTEEDAQQDVQQAYKDGYKAGRAQAGSGSYQFTEGDSQQSVHQAFEEGLKSMRREQQAFLERLVRVLIRGQQELLAATSLTEVRQPVEQTKANVVVMESGLNNCQKVVSVPPGGLLPALPPEIQPISPSSKLSETEDPKRAPSMVVAKQHSSILARKIDLNSQAMLADVEEEDAGAILKRMQEEEAEKAAGGTQRQSSTRCKIYTRFQEFVLGDSFESTFGIIILVNTIVMATDMQYNGEVAGADMDYPLISRPPGWLGDMLFWINEVLLWAFVVELVLKVAALRIKFFTTNRMWNWMDFLIVVSGVFDRFFSGGSLGVDPLILRLFRMMKLTRLLKMFKVQSALHTINYILKAVSASGSTLLWSMALLFMIQCAAGMVVAQLSASFISDPANDISQRKAVFRYYGTFTKTQFTLFEVTHVSYASAARVLTDHVSEWWAWFFITYRVSIAFAFINVVRAIFIQSTLKVADRDRELMLHNKRCVQQETTSKLRDMFKMMAQGEEELDEENFLKCCKSDSTKVWFSALDIDCSSPTDMWELLDLNGIGKVNIDEFSSAAAKLGGNSKTVDLYILLTLAERLESKIDMLLPLSANDPDSVESTFASSNFPDSGESTIGDTSAPDQIKSSSWKV